jgi:hypothetical protein
MILNTAPTVTVEIGVLKVLLRYGTRRTGAVRLGKRIGKTTIAATRVMISKR